MLDSSGYGLSSKLGRRDDSILRAFEEGPLPIPASVSTAKTRPLTSEDPLAYSSFTAVKTIPALASKEVSRKRARKQGSGVRAISELSRPSVSFQQPPTDPKDEAMLDSSIMSALPVKGGKDGKASSLLDETLLAQTTNEDAPFTSGKGSIAKESTQVPNTGISAWSSTEQRPHPESSMIDAESESILNSPLFTVSKNSRVAAKQETSASQARAQANSLWTN